MAKYNGEKIEICIFDAPKQEPVFTGCIEALYQYWIPGVTILGLLDYKFYETKDGKMRERFMAPVRFMEAYGDSFELIKSWSDECPMFFKYIKPLSNL